MVAGGRKDDGAVTGCETKTSQDRRRTEAAELFDSIKF